MTSFGDILRKIRIEKDISQEELATLLGTTKQVISRYENNQRSPKVSIVADYAEKLGIPISDLIGEKQEAQSILPPPDAQEAELLSIYRDLNTTGQQTLLGTARGLHANPDMKKDLESNATAI